MTVDDDHDSGQGVEAHDNEAYKSIRLEWAEAMWDNRGNTRIKRHSTLYSLSQTQLNNICK